MDIENVADKLSAPKADLSRRALVKAGWVVPVVLALGIPKTTMAQTSSSGGQTGGGGYDPGDDQ